MAEFRLSQTAQRDLDEIFDCSVAQQHVPCTLRNMDTVHAMTLINQSMRE